MSLTAVPSGADSERTENTSRSSAIAACDRSLRRLRTDRIDLYLLHWRGSVPLEETIDAFITLQRKGKIRCYGVSNFDVDDMEEAFALPGGDEIATNQVLYNLAHRGIEWDLMPWCRDRHIPIMAYSPVGHKSAEQKRMLGHPNIKSIAARHEATPAQVALAWLLRQPDIVAIPKASRPEHVRENRAALEIELGVVGDQAPDARFEHRQRSVDEVVVAQLGRVRADEQRSDAAVKASWTPSSAMSMSPKTRVSTATERPYSSRKTRSISPRPTSVNLRAPRAAPRPGAS